MSFEAMATGFEFCAEFQMIIDFAIKDDDCLSIIRNDGLISTMKILNFQTYSPQRDMI